ncbi:hypothetical protein NP493_4864g00000 [Ridgeia piscesae]|uniref:Uncharacterized protein n=1 Tax=Ridgeia piscesae TaxID=27915 RepID=A0AAD9MSG6_RIDPI|nr:hypothetical protein NP493_4864g00000 [Ridgeia piscesae]
MTLMRAETATLRDAIRYADFSADMKMYEIDDVASLEQTPSAALFDDVISGDVQLTSGTVVHALDDVTVYKCLGRTYTTTDSETATSYNLVIETASNDNTVYHVGDILTSHTSSGFLETVLGMWSTRVGTFVKTTLTGCNNLDVSTLKLSSPLANTSCIGGDNNPGLLMFDQTTQIDLNVGDVLSGRESSTIFVKVLSVRSSGSFVILEVANIDLVESGSVVTLLNPEHITERRVVRRKRDINVGISGGDTKSLKAGDSSVTASFKYSIGVRVTMHIEWDWFDIEVTRAGLTFSGSLSATAKGVFFYSKKVGRAGNSKTYSKDVCRFFIPVFGIPIPGRIYLNFQLGWSVAFKITSSSSKSYSGELEAEATATITATPSINAQWPAVSEPKKRPGKKNKKEKKKDLTSLVLSVEFPLFVTISGKACTCEDPEKHTEFRRFLGSDTAGHCALMEGVAVIVAVASASNSPEYDLLLEEITSSSSKSYSGELEAEATATITATPSINAQWPAVSEPKKRPGKKNKKEKKKDLTSLVLSVEFPLFVTISGKACTCEDPEKHTEFSKFNPRILNPKQLRTIIQNGRHVCV